MTKKDLTLLLEVTNYNAANIYFKLFEFLFENDFTFESSEPITTKYEIVEHPYRIYDLLEDNEYIRTSANEVPRENGGWRYNDGDMYDLYYVFLECNKLLVVECKNSVEDFSDDPHYVRFLLYSNADQFIIQVKEGHKVDRPYVNIVNSDGKLISEFYFEMPYDKSKILNNVSLKNVLSPVSVEQLVSKCQEKVKNKQQVLCKKR